MWKNKNKWSAYFIYSNIPVKISNNWFTSRSGGAQAQRKSVWLRPVHQPQSSSACDPICTSPYPPALCSWGSSNCASCSSHLALAPDASAASQIYLPWECWGRCAAACGHIWEAATSRLPWCMDSGLEHQEQMHVLLYRSHEPSTWPSAAETSVIESWSPIITSKPLFKGQGSQGKGR